jgi:hypothetical protein
MQAVTHSTDVGYRPRAVGCITLSTVCFRLAADLKFSDLNVRRLRGPTFTFDKLVGPLFIRNRSVSDNSSPKCANGCLRN